MILSAVFVGLASWLSWCLIAFLSNRQKVRRTGIPYIISPVTRLNFFWQGLSGAFPSLGDLSLPFGLTTKYTTAAWNYYDKVNPHKQHGKVFMSVAPGSNELIVADAAVAYSILSRRKDFPKPVEITKPLEMFGANVAGVEGAEWQRHRKITATGFTENNSGLVWAESLRQSSQMITYWEETQKSTVTTFTDDTKTVALHVLTSAGLGLNHEFHDPDNKPKDGYTLTYAQSLFNLMSSVLIIFVVPRPIIKLPYLPKSLRNFKIAKAEFDGYMKEQVSIARERLESNKTIAPNLLNMMVQKNDPVNGLSDTDIFGNLFLFSFAGHETTANTISYAFYLMVANPRVQEWVEEEVAHVLKGYATIEEADYAVIYPKLKRCMALMKETLRLFPAVLSNPRKTGSEPASLKIDGRECIIPANTFIWINIIGAATHEEYWGKDSLVWRPERWIESEGRAGDFEGEKMWEPVRGAFLAWSEGNRVCPGKKFSQVEFVGVIARLLWSHKVEVVPNAGESVGEARKRVVKVVEDSRNGITLAMKDPKSVRLQFSRR